MLTDAQNEVLKDYLEAAHDGSPFFEIHNISYNSGKELLTIVTEMMEIQGDKGFKTTYVDVYQADGNRRYDLEEVIMHDKLVDIPEEWQMSDAEREIFMIRLKQLMNTIGESTVNSQ